MHDFITGIQQIGIGVCNGPQSLRTYAHLFGMNVLVFNDVSEASLMTRYTGGKAYLRQAMLSLNMQGGGGFEIWQFMNREPAQPVIAPAYGDIGIYAPKIKAPDIAKAHAHFLAISEVHTSPLLQETGMQHFWVTDSTGLPFQIVESTQWFSKNSGIVGGVTGAVIGVSNMDRACAFYKWLLQTDELISDDTVTYSAGNGQKKESYRRVLLRKKVAPKGAFGKLLGPVELELVQSLDRQPQKIYADRLWGDCGFIHLCFDVINMCGLKASAKSVYPFTIDSINSFGMEKASGRFCYMEDPDGTLIELVETHKVPIFKKGGIYLDLKKRNLAKPLPDWMIRLLALSKVK